MAKPKIPNQRKANLDHSKRTERYAQLIRHVYERMAQEAAILASIAEADPSRPFSFSDYPLTKEAIRRLQAQLAMDVEATIMAGTSKEWQESNLVQDLVATKVLKAYTGKSATGEEYHRYYQTNPEALEAFNKRRTSGMTLSDRVWNLSEQYRVELEDAISAAIAPGQSAQELSMEVRRYLNEPDLMFRRFRYKNEQGEWKRKWKKRYTDDEGNVRFIDCDRDSYRNQWTGPGYYKSAAKNAMRLARTEINMAYRTAEQERWRQFDFVVGYEVKTTQNGKHVEDICDMLAGKYPKDFKFTGWHPQCRCYCIPILKTEDEFWAYDPQHPQKSANEITELPPNFREWINDNKERIESSEKRGKLPYFIRDNREDVEEILKPKEKTPLEIAAERHAARTQEDVVEIRENWSYRRIDMLWDTIATGDLPYEFLEIIKELKDDVTKGNFDEFNRKARDLNLAITNDDIRNKLIKDLEKKQIKTKKSSIKDSKQTVNTKSTSKVTSEQEKITKIRAAIDQKKIEDIYDVQRIFREFYNQFPEEFNNVFVNITTFDRPIKDGRFIMGYSKHDKEIAFNTNSGSKTESPFATLVNALNKIRDGKKLTLEQHRSINTVVHELLHQKAEKYVRLKPHNAGDYKRTAMETMNEYASRNLHKQFLERLGATNLEGHKDLIRKGDGYTDWINRLIDFVDAAKLKHEEVGMRFAETLVTKPYDSMDKEIYDFFKSHVDKKDFTESMDEVLGALECHDKKQKGKWELLLKKWFH